ncbi:MAG: hypothetical protein J5999_01555 [Oscillospiraceae bacterium]|nr:hypothetical protein [Oscillospiraceae bacterium]
MKKYLISFFCLFTMLFSLTACGQSEGVVGDDTDNAEASVSDEKKPEKDKNPDESSAPDGEDTTETEPAESMVEVVESALSEINGALDVIAKENDGNPEVGEAIITIRDSSNLLASSYLDSEDLEKPTPAVITGRILMSLYNTETFYGNWFASNIESGTIRFGFYDMTGDGIPELFVETSDAICSITNIVDVSEKGFKLLAQIISPKMADTDEIQVTWYTGNRGLFHVSNNNRAGGVSEIKVIIEPTEDGAVKTYWYSTSDNNLGNADKKLADYQVVGKGMKTTRIFAASEVNYENVKAEIEKIFEITEPVAPAETDVTDKDGNPVETEETEKE